MTKAVERTDVPWLAARQLAHHSAEPLTSRVVPLADAAGTTLAAPLLTREAMPAFDTAAMDGYALAAPQPSTVIGTVLAGDPPWAAALRPAEAVRISTGAPVPPGAAYVLRQEDALVDGSTVSGPEQPAGTHIRRRGEDAEIGDELVARGTRIGAALLGLAAACGYNTLEVVPRPSVSVIISGDEVATTSDDLLAGRVRDAIGPMLPTLIEGLGGSLTTLRHVPDRPADLLASAVDDATRAGVDVIVISGATSIGPADGLRGLLEQTGAECVVESVACRPGHPQLLARWPGGPCIVGLPGNPFAAFVAAHTLLGPLLAGLAGRELPRLPQIVLAEAVTPARGRATRLVPISWDGAIVGEPAQHRPASLRAAAAADALAAVPADWIPGTPVPAVPLH